MDADENSEFSRLTERIEELEKALKPFADGLAYIDQMGDAMRQEYLSCISCTGQFGEADLRFARSTLEAGSTK